MRILSFTGGAGAMYCGSCLRDNALAAALLARGHDVVLTPVYTPTRTDERNVSQAQVFFGGISVFLEQQVPLFRHTPRVFDRIWDAPWVIRLATKRQIKVDPASLGQMTVSMLRGEQGFQAKEVAKLLEWLRGEPRFDVINLPYALLLGLAEPLRRELKAPICCTLQGEDLFLDGLGGEHKAESLALIRATARHVDLFLPVSEYYRDFMPGYLGVPREKMRVVPLGINMEGYTLRPQRREPPFTVGYLARIAPEKGLHVLCEAYHVLRQREPMPAARLVAAGYLAPEHRPYLEEIRRKMREWGLDKEFEYRGEVDRAQKTAFLQSIDVFSVPAVYEEPKGLFLLEALANGVPVVQPKRGAFPEILDKTGGGLIVPPGDSSALADAWLDLWRDPEEAFALGRAGAQGVREHYDVGVMAEAAEQAYRSLAVTH
ncbi:MAG TPA: glycosyltransferase family 4 protein [Vicinamibacterales bacterium]|nr:glycosyltransferase family 4 protein [Vicinamibacterales bacterium]